MKYYAHYRKADGLLLQGETWNWKESEKAKPDLHPDADTLLETDILLDPAKHYIERGKYKNKQTLDTYYEVSGLSVRFPYIYDKTDVFIQGTAIVHDKGELEIEVDHPQTLRIVFSDSAKFIGQAVEVTID